MTSNPMFQLFTLSMEHVMKIGIRHTYMPTLSQCVSYFRIHAIKNALENDYQIKVNIL